MKIKKKKEKSNNVHFETNKHEVKFNWKRNAILRIMLVACR